MKNEELISEKTLYCAVTYGEKLFFDDIDLLKSNLAFRSKTYVDVRQDKTVFNDFPGKYEFVKPYLTEEYLNLGIRMEQWVF